MTGIQKACASGCMVKARRRAVFEGLPRFLAVPCGLQCLAQDDLHIYGLRRERLCRTRLGEGRIKLPAVRQRCHIPKTA